MDSFAGLLSLIRTGFARIPLFIKCSAVIFNTNLPVDPIIKSSFIEKSSIFEPETWFFSIADADNPTENSRLLILYVGFLNEGEDKWWDSSPNKTETLSKSLSFFLRSFPSDFGWATVTMLSTIFLLEL